MMYAVIMAGGSGTRLWPLSRKSQPKQALKLIGDQTMFQHAVRRLSPLFTPEQVFVVTSPAMAELLRPQTPEVPAENFILEPEGRDSGPAAGLAAIELLKRDPEAIMVMLTADHFIVDTGAFRAALDAAGQVASAGTIVTLGVRPTFPATGFGYIELGEALTIVNGYKIYQSAGFREKPDERTALAFVEGQRHVWNSGMFIWQAERYLSECRQQLPDLYAVLQQMAGLPAGSAEAAEAWSRAPRVSIDFGVMEHARDVAVIPVEFGWTDVGSWAALLDVLPADTDGNVVTGQMVAVDSSGCFVRSDARLVATIGLTDMVIVDTPDVLLVCPKDRAQDVREIVKRLTAESRHEYL